MLYTRLRAFNAVASAGGFSAAAASLGISQPALSIHVKALETAYGIQLFERRGRGIRLTRAGRDLFALTRQLLGLEQEIEETLSRPMSLARERLRLAVDGPHITMPIVARFRAREPDVDLHIMLGNTRTVRRRLLEREADVAILPRIGGDARVHAVPLRQHEAVVIVGRGHRWYGRRRIHASDLAGVDLVGREPGSNTQRAVEEGLSQVGVKPHITMRLDSREAIKEAVAANLGFAIVWASEVESSERLHVVRLVGVSITSTDYLACLKDSYRRRTVASLFRIAEQRA